MTADLQELLARVENAERPDREVDAELWRALLPDDYRHATGQASGLRARGEDLETWTRAWAKSAASPYTASLDAALALVERVLPKSDWTVSNESPIDGPGPFAWVQPEIGEGSRANAKTPALALLAVLLRALISTHSEEGAG